VRLLSCIWLLGANTRRAVLFGIGQKKMSPVTHILFSLWCKADELRAQIEPQVIRRTKTDVAKDLPKKIEVPNCHVEFSNEQRALYVGALQLFHQTSASEEDDAKLHHLGLLQYLRLVCADPRRYGVEAFVPEEPGAYRRKAPKMEWLLSILERIRHQGEKVLVFAEHRDVQRMLQYYINAVMKVKPQIVNGDTAVTI
jgi:SNF2 family DNA or RNA helicase